MSDQKTYTVEEAHEYFAIKSNSRVWELLDKSERSNVEDEEMLHAAHASLYHWLHVGSGLHHQRGVWMIARVHTVLGNGEQATFYSNRCLELTHKYESLLEDFDFAFANESVARVHALIGEVESARTSLKNAEEAGEKIGDEVDRQIFFDDLNSGDWYGVR